VIKRKKVSLFLDSGAFSAWARGITIDLEEYIVFCLKHIDYVDVIASLDVIPGEGMFGKIDSDDVKRSARQGWLNYHEMLKAGIPKEKLIHTFHQGEDFKWLKRMVRSIPYIALSPANDKTTDQKRIWLDGCMKYVVDECGTPLVKFHGFGVTSVDLVIRYPWYSVDSTSWVKTGRFGGVYVPRKISGKFVYHKTPWKVNVSARSPSKTLHGKHFFTFSKEEQKTIQEYFEMKGYKIGKSVFKGVDKKYELKENERWWSKGNAFLDSQGVEFGTGKNVEGRIVEKVIEPGLSTEYRLRDELNIKFFLDMEEYLPPWPEQKFKVKSTGKFDF